MATDTLHPESAPATASNVIPFRRRPTLLIEINSPIPSPHTMSREEYATAWRTLCCYADEARAYRDYLDAHWLVLRRTDEDAAERLFGARNEAFDKMRAFVECVASLPVPVGDSSAETRRDIDRKKHIIGRVWLRAEGKRYDTFRASIAADEAMLQLGRR